MLYREKKRDSSITSRDRELREIGVRAIESHLYVHVMEQSQELIMIYLSYISLTTAILQNKQGMSYRIVVVKIKEVKWIMTSSIKIVEQCIK